MKKKSKIEVASETANNIIAKKKLKDLEEYFEEPVLPMSEYCKAFETWAECIMKAQNEEGDLAHGSNYAEHLSEILIDIQKSNLLYRLLYEKQMLRTRKCPVHNGHWSGYNMSDDPCECCDGPDITGWLPESNE